MKKIEIDGIEIEYEIKSIANNALFKLKIEEESYEVFVEGLSNGEMVYLKAAVDTYQMISQHRRLIVRFLEFYLEADKTKVEFA